MFVFCFFKQKTAYEMRISDWSSDVCSSDLLALDNRIELQPLGRVDRRFKSEAAGTILDERHGEAGVGIGHGEPRAACIDTDARSLFAMRGIAPDKRAVACRWVGGPGRSEEHRLNSSH